eukprot:6828421-Alexandrium_andersonii.AAC.2
MVRVQMHAGSGDGTDAQVASSSGNGTHASWQRRQWRGHCKLAVATVARATVARLSLIHISEPTRLALI